MAASTLRAVRSEASAISVPVVALAAGTPGDGAILALDLGQRTGWAVRNADGAIASGTAEFKPGRFEGGLSSPAGSCVWHVVGLQRSVREWAIRRAGTGGRWSRRRRRGSLWRR